MKHVQSGGRDNWPWLFRPLGKGFWPDVQGALAALAGVGIGVLLFGNPAALLGAAIGVTAMVILRAVRRRVDP